jgi:quinol monooxygenase YgiN
MPPREKVVSIHPWFKVHPGRLADFKALLPRFVERTASEPDCLYYDFTSNGDVIHCREAYVGAEALLGHIQHVGDLLDEAQKIADVARLEIHGSAAELEKLKGPLAALPVEWFTFETGLQR